MVMLSLRWIGGLKMLWNTLVNCDLPSSVEVRTHIQLVMIDATP